MARRRLFHVQVLVTQRCNAVCLHCDKAVGYARFPEIEMTEQLMKEYVDRAIAEDFKINRITLSGGEPILNHELQGILNQCGRLPYVDQGRVLTNDLNRTREQRSKIRMPNSKFDWAPAPLDNLDDPKSGKNKPGVRYRDRTHMPYWISPKDYGVESKFEWCSIRNFCGRGLDNVGWSMCGQAPILGRILSINPYLKRDTITEIVDTEVKGMCEHCIYGVYKGEHNKAKRTAVEKFARDLGVEKSPTFEKALANKPQVYTISTEKVNT